MQRLKLGLVCLSWLIMASAVSAQMSGDPTSNSGVANVQNFSGGGMLNGTYFNVRQVIGDGVGWTNSYSQIGLFTPFWIDDNNLIAPNVQLIVTNSTQTGVNAGLVGRTYVDDIDRIFGVYGYYDNDQDNYNNRFSQFTVGAETLGTWWDARANGYFVSGMNNAFLGAQGIVGNPFYVGNYIAFTGLQSRDQALSGGDAEIGMPVSPYTQWLRAYAGVYGYQTGSSETIGFRGRMEATVSNDLSLSVMVTQDALFGTNVNGVIDFKFSGFLPTRYFPNWTTKQRMLNPVQRNWRIATHEVTQAVDVDAINPATNKPYFITHVNNTAAAGGNGTIEHPYNHLVSSPQADIILVHLGNANTLANAVTGSAVLSNNQRLLGDGILSTVVLSAQYGGTTINGTYILPQTNNSGIYPYVTNPGGDIVTLANNNEVAGLNLIGSGGSAITNTAAGSNSFNLHNLEIANNAGYGINLTNASGSGILSSINVGTTDHHNPQGIGNNALGGIQISTGSPGLNLQASNVYMNSAAAGTQAFGMSLTAATGYLNANLTNVFANGNAGTGIQLGETGQDLAASLNNIQANNNGGAGVGISGTGGSINVTGNDVSAIGNSSDNLQIGTQADPVTGAVVNVTMNNSSFSNSTGGSGVVFSGSGTFGTLNLTSSVYGNALDGLDIFATNGSLINATVLNSNFTNNGRDAFHVVSDTGSTVNLGVDPTNASGSGRDGLFYQVGQNATFNGTFINTNFNNSGNSAAYGMMSNFATLNLYFNKTTGANSGADGFYLNATNNSTANINIQDGTFQNSGVSVAGSSAVNINSDDSAVTILTDNTISGQPANFSFGGNISSAGVIGNQAYGLTLNIQNNSVFNGAFENGDFSNALTNAINANVLSNSNATLTLFNTNGNKSGADGFAANVDNATFVANMNQSNLNNSGANGANFTVSNGGNMTANFSSSTINNSGANGILTNVTGAGSVETINLVNSSNINDSNNSGVNFNVSGGTLNVNGVSDTINNSGFGGTTGSGVLGVVTNSGTANLGFLNMTINNNLDNGVFVTTTTGGNINATFDLGSVSNNGTNFPANFNDGIRLVMDNSPSSSLNIVNGVTITGNGNNGVSIIATDGAQLSGIFQSSSIVNNGVGVTVPGQGVGLYINSDGQNGALLSSNVSLNMSGMAIDNTTAGGPQIYNLLTSSSNAGQISVAMNSSDLSNATLDGINSTVATTSTTSLSFADVTADNSGLAGALLNVTSGGILNFTDYSSGSAITSSISNSGQAGILVSVDGTGSYANFNIDGLNLNSNGRTFGGQGFSGTVTNGGNLNAFIANSSIATNANQGIQIDSLNANSVARFNVFNTQVTNNGSEGLLINVSDNGTSYYRSIDSVYSNNGSSGGLDGVQINATGTGALNSATAISLFAGDTIDNNAGNGMSLNASLGATLTTSLQNVDISNNLGYGIDISADNTVNTQFNLIMTGTNTLNNNTLGSFNNLDFSGINQVVLELTGTFSNPNGDGVHVALSNIVNAEVAIEGPGTIDNSGGNGIFVSMNNVTNGSLLVSGFSEINNSLLDGIDVVFNTVNSGAIEIDGATTIDNSGGAAVDINLTNTNLVNNLNYTGATIQILTLTDNLPTVPGNPALDNALPIPVTVNLNGLGITPPNALTIDGITAATSGKNGIIVTAAASTIGANGTFIENNNITGSKLNGLEMSLTNTPVTGMTIAGNTFSTNNLDGIRFDLNSSSLSTVNFTSNTISGNGVTGTGNGIEFTSTTGSVVNSDLQNIVLTTNTITSNNGDGVRLVNPNPANAANPVSMDYENNTITGNTGTGVNLNLMAGGQSLVTTFSGNTISSNTGGPGINVILNNQANFTSGFGGNTIDNNGKQGINIQTATGGIVTANFIGNTIDGNTSDGITLTLGTGGQFNGAEFYGNTISQNKGMGVDFTVASAATFDWNLGDISQAANTISGNTGAGVGIMMLGSSSGTLIVENTTMSNTLAGTGTTFNGQGLYVDELGNSVLQGAIVASKFTGNAKDGAEFTVTGNELSIFSTLENFTVGNYSTAALGNTFSNNGTNGLEFIRTANGIISGNAAAPIELGFNTFDNNGSNGLSITAQNTLSTDYYNMNNNDFSSNSGNGIHFFEEADAHISANMTQNTIENNGGNGILLTEQVNNVTDHRALNGVWTLNTITGNSGNGILLAGAVQTLTIGDATNAVLGNVISSNKLNGIEDTGAASGTALMNQTTMVIGNNTIQFNGSGALGTAAENAGILMDVAPVSRVTIVSNNISFNNGDGVQYQNAGGGFESIYIDNNNIASNTGRGVNLQNAGSNTMEADISGNQVTANGLEGIYVVNTADTTQQIYASSTNAMSSAGGGINATPYLQLRIVGNQIIGNGKNSQLGATGLVVRVGTAYGVTTTSGTFDGGFAQQTPAAIAANTAAAVFFNQTSASQTYPGVIAQIDSNQTGGNFGNDISFSSFDSVAQANVPTSAGAWNNNLTSAPPTLNFAPTSITSDPLSRFDLYFRDNTTDSNSFDPLGAGLKPPPSANSVYAPNAPDVSYVAFYDNAEGTFKSATQVNTTTVPTVPGPFFSATRDRNATREGGTFATYNTYAPTVGFPAYNSPNGNNFYFPGIGPSTWRVSTDSVTGGGGNTNATFINGQTATTSNNPYTGIYFTGNTFPDDTSYIFGEF